MRPRVAGSLDDVPRAGSEGPKGAEGDGLVGVVVDLLGPDDRVVVLVLLKLRLTTVFYIYERHRKDLHLLTHS